ncbi:tudor domain-containing protein 3 [Babesia caballi]|uniref:Tudor domain-containing protein 3 n=1 Tax=Babesia caballi TaxID=5871 RepID=A0AAV4M2L0_BABCB|nr:tudor domain-containing protein 3 [Babesia caballi]
MPTEVDGLSEVLRAWNLKISPTQALELARLGGIMTNKAVDGKTLMKALLNVDIAAIRVVLDGADAAAATKEGLVPSVDVDALGRPLLCQVTRVVDVTQPRDGVSRSDNPSNPLYKLTLTTGRLNFHALIMDVKLPITALAPGTKVLLTEPKLLHVDSMALLRPKQYEVLGGVVPELHQPWAVQREVNYQRFAAGGRRPPSDAPKFEPLEPCSAKLVDELGGLKLRPPSKPAGGQPPKETQARRPNSFAPKSKKEPNTAYKARHSKLQDTVASMAQSHKGSKEPPKSGDPRPKTAGPAQAPPTRRPKTPTTAKRPTGGAKAPTRKAPTCA